MSTGVSIMPTATLCRNNNIVSYCAIVLLLLCRNNNIVSYCVILCHSIIIIVP